MQQWLVLVVAVVVFQLVVMFANSFDSLEYQEIGLNFSWMRETVQKEPYTSGLYYLGLGNHFIKFPSMVKSIFFIDDVMSKTQGPALTSRTLDGLNVRLEVSFQYKLKVDQVYDLYTTLGKGYEKVLVRMAIEQLTTAATKHNAHYFFTHRTNIAEQMHEMLDVHFKKHAFSEVPFFQLRTVHLPDQFELAIKETQVKQQFIDIARLQQKSSEVIFQTTVLQAEQAVKVRRNQAEAEAASILLQNQAYCDQYNLTQVLQTASLQKLKRAAGWSADELLQYLRIRAMREHPSEMTTIRL
mmetsp:Transcript_66976/g.196544  ORF Transcript_66976/g.196544 Transcript_66976/m.196544 type:complete len:298 (-) Transcript_66976:23-916(-)